MKELLKAHAWRQINDAGIEKIIQSVTVADVERGQVYLTIQFPGGVDLGDFRRAMSFKFDPKEYLAEVEALRDAEAEAAKPMEVPELLAEYWLEELLGGRNNGGARKIACKRYNDEAEVPVDISCLPRFHPQAEGDVKPVKKKKKVKKKK